MNFDPYTQTLIWAFGLSVVFGAIANKSNFCTMGAVSDWINIGDLNRLRSWALAIAVAILGAGLLEYLGYLELSLTASNDSSSPPYRTANLVWPRNILGGLMFGVGMTLASGCGNKTLVRLGEGNMKSLIVLIIMSLSASVMIFTSFDYIVFLQWMTPVSIDLTQYEIESQDIGSVLAGITGSESSAGFMFVVALLVGGALLIWSLASREFRSSLELLVAGIVIGGLVVIAWYITAGPSGLELLEELDFMDEQPYATGAQSLSFVAPSAHLSQYLYQGFSPLFFSFGLATLIGVITGSFLYALIFRKLRLEWFVDLNDFLRHFFGAILMGVGGVLAMGCTIGQGISGFSTLAIGSILSTISIIIGSAAYMKYQFYLMMREDT
ncbi:MAG: YeeE/YedE family protein [Pseudomonadota bacterium]